jgi:hypothetical protein
LWSELAKDCPRLAYVAFSRLALTDLRTRQQVRAAQELLLKVPRYMLMLVEPINMEHVVARIVWHVIRLGD